MTRMFLLMIIAVFIPVMSPNAQDSSTTEEPPESTSAVESEQSMVPDQSSIADERQQEAVPAAPRRSASVNPPSQLLKGIESSLTKLKLNCSIEMQVDKDMFNDYGVNGTDNRFTAPVHRNYRRAADDFWMRVGLMMSYTGANLETVASFRFYPYWTMRRAGPYDSYQDLNHYLDYIELTRAYIKAFKDYRFGGNSLMLHFKVGRDGLLNSCGQLFGNYLDIAVGGYGQSRFSNFTGPFKNRKIFANQIQVATQVKIGNVFMSKTDIMFGGNMNNEKWYTAPQTPIFQQLDSKLSAGFFRCYLDLYFVNERIHFGTGYRNYFTKVLEDNIYKTDKWRTANWAFDAVILPDLKYYCEFAFQSIGVTDAKTSLRPVTMGLTVPTGKVLDILAVELENVGETFFSGISRRDQVGLMKTEALAWGMVAEKTYAERVTVAWGLYPGNASGDMKTSLRLSANF